MKRSTLLFAAIAASAMFACAQTPITQPPEPVDPSPINGETYYLMNQLSGLQMDFNGSSKANGDYVTQKYAQFLKSDPALGDDEVSKWQLEDQQHLQRIMSGQQTRFRWFRGRHCAGPVRHQFSSPGVVFQLHDKWLQPN